MIRWLGAVLCMLACASCSQSRADAPPPHRAFYYWRTTFTLSEAERSALAELHVDRLYVRMFDVAWADRAAAEAGPLSVASPPPAEIEIVPVVFVRDEVFHHPTPGLAARTWRDVQRIAGELHATVHELQVDCDWTDTTQHAFFAFLDELRAVSHVTLSATIRLHQIKYRERTGVPPVERGMLMFYNMGRFSADPHARVIFDPASAEHYLARIGDYPLPLDVALPIWSWVLQLRDDEVVGLMQSTDPDELPKLDFLRPIAPGQYAATRTAFLHGALLREGDVLKIEVTAPDDVRAAAAMVAPHLAASKSSRTISLFDLSERNLARHGTSSLDQVFRTVR